ncbi:MAG: alkaline phosphatase D family protein [Hyphomonadaceae bacterium]
MLIDRRGLFLGAAALPRAAWAGPLARGVFTHGVASGDPLSDGVVLWARFIGGDGRLAWEIAEDEAFARVAQRGEVTASAANDFCAKADVRGLAPGRRYFYRFLSASGPSLTGQTRTAPSGGADSLNIALFSCSNYAFGYFHAYGHAAAREDIDLVLHVGDYIYEYGRGDYPSEREAVSGRILDPAGECIRLQDYYQRYATYHTDPNLLALRQAKPICVVWDDHEIANDTWREGAQNHSEAFEGAFADRVAAASKAYFDWMPIRRPERRGPRIYRSLDWGSLARILLLDTRLIGRDRQLDYRSALAQTLAQGGADADAAIEHFRAETLNNPNRTMMGAAQERWFAESLAESKRQGQTWQIVAQQVVMGEQLMAQGAAQLLPADAAAGSRTFARASERAGAAGLPWNLDSWGGYPAARARFLEACAANASNAIVLGGDSHNCWLNNLPAAGGARLAAIEFAGGSVTSPGFERTLSAAGPGEREALMQSANPQLAWCDLTHRGYGALRFTPSACDAQWIAFADVRSPQASAAEVTRFASAASAGGGPGGWTHA